MVRLKCAHSDIGCLYVSMCACMYVCRWECMYDGSERHREIERERQRERATQLHALNYRNWSKSRWMRWMSDWWITHVQDINESRQTCGWVLYCICTSCPTYELVISHHEWVMSRTRMNDDSCHTHASCGTWPCGWLELQHTATHFATIHCNTLHNTPPRHCVGKQKKERYSSLKFANQSCEICECSQCAKYGVYLKHTHQWFTAHTQMSQVRCHAYDYVMPYVCVTAHTWTSQLRRYAF